MSNANSPEAGAFGRAPLDAVDVPEPALDALFVALWLTAATVFFAGNLLLFSAPVLLVSVKVVLPCFSALLILYFLSRRLGSLIRGTALTYGLLWLVVSIRWWWLVPMFYGLAAFSAVYAARAVRAPRGRWPEMALMAVIAAAAILGVDRAYTSFDMVSRLHEGSIAQDTVYNAALAAMIKNYGVASTGLHGLVETPYHTFSHALMASISLLSGVSVIEVYGVAPWVLFAPLLLFGVAASCAALDRAGRLPIPIVWAVTAVLLVIAPILLGRWAVYDSYFVSDTYLVGLGVFIPGLALLYKRSLTLSDLLVVSLLSAMIAGAKSPLGVVFAGLWLARLLFVRGGPVAFDASALAASALVTGWVVADSTRAYAGAMRLDALHFVRMYSFLGSHVGDAQAALRTGAGLTAKTALLAALSVLSFLAFHFLMSWAVVVAIARRGGVSSVLKEPLGAFSLSATIAGVAVASAVGISGGSAYYFTNVALFVSLPGVVALLARAADRAGRSHRALLSVGALLVVLVNLKPLYNASALSRPPDVRRSALIDRLITARASAPMSAVLRPDLATLEENPIERCTAQPFLYPAVSERAWVDVIPATRGACQFTNYGYGQYGLTAEQREVTAAPRLLSGMTIEPWK